MISTLCSWTGITDYYKSVVTNAGLALLITNPTMALSGVLTVWVAKLAADRLSEKQARDEIQRFTDRFCKVTSNMNNRYEAANLAITTYFKSGDS